MQHDLGVLDLSLHPDTLRSAGPGASTIAAYEKTLEQFREYIRLRQGDVEPGQVTARHVLEYVNYLRQERHNGDAAVNRQVTVLKNFYRAIVAMGHLEPAANPLRALPEDEGQAAQAARRVVGRGSPESAGQSAEGYCSGLGRSGDPGVVIRHGDPRLGVRDVDGGERSTWRPTRFACSARAGTRGLFP